jgi:hypothetical protein
MTANDYWNGPFDMLVPNHVDGVFAACGGVILRSEPTRVLKFGQPQPVLSRAAYLAKYATLEADGRYVLATKWHEEIKVPPLEPSIMAPLPGCGTCLSLAEPHPPHMQPPSATGVTCSSFGPQYTRQEEEQVLARAREAGWVGVAESPVEKATRISNDSAAMLGYLGIEPFVPPAPALPPQDDGEERTEEEKRVLRAKRKQVFGQLLQPSTQCLYDMTLHNTVSVDHSK